MSKEALKRANIKDGELAVVCGDVPNFFYNVQLPEAMAGFLHLEGVDTKALQRELERQGVSAPSLSEHGAVGLSVCPMGFSWSPVLAQACLENRLCAAGLPSEGRVYHGQPAPMLEKTGEVSTAYLDDCAVIVG